MRTGERTAGQVRVRQRLPGPSRRLAALAQQRLGPTIAGSVLPFALVFYLALKGGGYDEIVRSEVGIAVWWLVLLGTLAGVLPRARVSRAGWVGVATLIAFAAWTGLAIAWSGSGENSAAELARVASYVGVFALALFGQGRDGLARTVNAVALAIALVGGLALLSRLHPAWFPTSETAHFLPEEGERLNYPLNYWNGLAAMMAIGLPLVLAAAVQARRPASQAIATAALPVMALTAYYTFSRGGALEIAIALVTFFALYPRRLIALPTFALGTAGSALLIAAATQRGVLEDELASEAARAQGDEMLAVVLVVCTGVALIRIAIGLIARHGLGPRLTLSPRTKAAPIGVVASVALVIALLAGVPGELADRWEEFKQPAGAGVGSERFVSTAGNARYQYWQSMLDANATDPLKGIGPGTFEYWWTRERTSSVFVREAHSLYFETLGELGIVGLALIAGLIAWAGGTGIARCLRAPPERRGLLAAATAACVGFAVTAGIDWAWELAVLPVTFLLVAAAVLAPRPGETSNERRALPLLIRWVAVPAIAIGSIVAIAIPMAATALVRESQEEVRASNLGAALGKARSAVQVQPYAASPTIQEALVLQAQGDMLGAIGAARDATEKEPANWRTWYILSRVAAESGRPTEAARAYREARSLNPRSPLFASPDPPLSTPE